MLREEVVGGGDEEFKRFAIDGSVDDGLFLGRCVSGSRWCWFIALLGGSSLVLKPRINGLGFHSKLLS